MPDGIIVLQSSPSPRPTTNPYIVMLQEALDRHPAIDLRLFSWREAILGRYDLFHVHWPEILADGRTPLRRWVRGALTLLLVLRLRLRRTAVVRTVHNVLIPEGLSRFQLFLLRELNRQTSLYIALNPETQLPVGTPSVVIAHGHYREWFASRGRSQAVAGRIAFVGLIRRYKGVERLIQVFRHSLDHRADISLTIGGSASTPELEGEIRRLSAGEERISLSLHFLDDQKFVDIVTSSELVVLPYRFMHNSGGALAALSLDRPVLVPDNAVNRALADEVGENWVYRYSTDLDSVRLLETIGTMSSDKRLTQPNLDARDWGTTGQAHHAAYLRALEGKRRSDQVR